METLNEPENERNELYKTFHYREFPDKEYELPICLLTAIATFEKENDERQGVEVDNLNIITGVVKDLLSDKYDEKRLSQTLSEGIDFYWIRHQRFSTYTFISSDSSAQRQILAEIKLSNGTRIVDLFEIRVLEEISDIPTINRGDDISTLIKIGRIFLDKLSEEGRAIEKQRKKAEESRENKKESNLSAEGKENKEYRESINSAIGNLEASMREPDDNQRNVFQRIGNEELEDTIEAYEGSRVYAPEARELLKEAPSIYGNFAMKGRSSVIWASFLPIKGGGDSWNPVDPTKFIIFNRRMNAYQKKRIIQLVSDSWGYFIVSAYAIRQVKREIERIQRVDEILELFLGLASQNDSNTAEDIKRIEESFKKRAVKNNQGNGLNELKIPDSIRGKEFEWKLYTLLHLTKEIEGFYSRIGNHLSSVAAYSAIVSERLEQLEIKKIHGSQRISTFINERLMPDVRLCENIENQLKALSKQAIRLTDMIQTKVNLDTQEQNTDLLFELKESSQHQVELQTVVELLSIFPLSYYTFAFIDKGFKKILITFMGDKFYDLWSLLGGLIIFILFCGIIGRRWLVKRQKALEQESNNRVNQTDDLSGRDA